MTSDEHPAPEDSATSGARLTRRQVLAGAALGAGALTGASALIGCSPANSGGGAPGDVRHRTLFIAGWQWSTPTNFNPLNPTAAFPAAPDQKQVPFRALLGLD